MARNIMRDSQRVESIRVPRATFNRKAKVLTAIDAGYMIPLLVDEIYPGETIQLRTNIFARVATMLKPVMDDMYIDLFGFFCSSRVLWPNFVKLMGEQVDPGDSIDYTVPTFTSGSAVAENSLADYLGLPIGKANVLQGVSALPFRMYNKLFNDWVRRQDLVDSAPITTNDGPDNYADYTLRRRMKRSDYFTSAQPWPLKSGELVTIPVGTAAPVGPESSQSDGNLIGVQNGPTSSNYHLLDLADATHVGVDTSSGSVKGTGGVLHAYLEEASGVTPREFRQAFQVSRFLERDMRAGTRYPEIVMSHYGVSMPHSQWRSEFLGYSSRPVNVTPVANTSATATEDQGQLAAFGTGTGNLNITKSFVEHGYLMILVNARCNLTYSQGIRRMWSKSTRYDFMFPEFSHVGDQAILNKEIFYNNDANDDLVFGYQEQYADLRYLPSIITGIFRPDATASLDPWHYSEDFGSLPVLNTTFIEDNPPVDRTIAVSSEPHLLLDGYIDLRHTRPIPAYGTPGLLDHI